MERFNEGATARDEAIKVIASNTGMRIDFLSKLFQKLDIDPTINGHKLVSKEGVEAIFTASFKDDTKPLFKLVGKK